MVDGRLQNPQSWPGRVAEGLGWQNTSSEEARAGFSEGNLHRLEEGVVDSYTAGDTAGV